MNWPDVCALIRQLGLRVRLRIRGAETQEWGSFLGVPTSGYLEVHGPHSLTDVVCVEVDPVEVRHRGRLVAPLLVDRRAELLESLARLGFSTVVLESGVVAVGLDR